MTPITTSRSPVPEDGAMVTSTEVTLQWQPGMISLSSNVYFGENYEAVSNATPEDTDIFQGNMTEITFTVGSAGSSYPSGLSEKTTYYWRIDEINDLDANSPLTGEVWTFTVGNYLIIDDFEDYNTGDNQIWFSWHDGLGAGTPDTEPYFPGNGTGSAIGDDTTDSYTEETIVQQDYAYYSETQMELSSGNDWTREGVTELSLWFRGYSVSVGSFVEGPAGTYTMTASGTDITGFADEFHFAYKMMSGPGSIVAKVLSVSDTDPWAKAGIMIRETLEPGSKHALACVTPGSGVASEGRIVTDGESYSANQAAIIAPHWVKLQRDISGNFTVSHSTDGTNWVSVTGAGGGSGRNVA